MMIGRSLLLLLAGSLGLVAGLPSGHADDWAVRRSPFNLQVVGRYKALLERRPHDGHALARLIKLYRTHRSVATLVQELRTLARSKPKVSAHHIVLGHLYRRLGQLDEAIASFERARKLRPASSSVPASLAALYRKQGDKAQALAAYDQALALARSGREKRHYLRALADIALADRDIRAARGYFERLVQLEPRNLSLRTELAQALARSGNHQEAIAEYQHLLKRTSDSSSRADLLKQIGEQQHELGRTDQAVATYRRAMALASSGHWIRRELTERIIAIYREKEDLGSLIDLFEKNWKHKGHFEYQVLGQLYDETGDETRALEAYQAALRRSRHAVDTRLRLIALLERAGRDKEVLSEYRNLARVAPGEPRYQLELARRLHRAGHQDEATRVLEACSRRFPTDASAHSAIADIYARWGDHRRALHEAQVLVRIEPRDESHLITLGEQYYLRGQKRKAIDTWKRLLTVIPQRHRAYAKLAELYGQHDMTRQAIATYHKAIKLSPRTLAYQRSLALLFEQKRMTSESLDAWEGVLRLAKTKGRQQSQREARTHVINILHRSYRLRHRIRAYRAQFDSSGDTEAGFFLAEAYLKQNDLQRAANVYWAILAKQQDNVEALEALEAVCRRQRKLFEAVDLLKRLAVLQPKNAREYFQRIANLQLQLYNDKEALLYAHKAVELSTQDAGAYQRLGQLYERKDDFEGAVSAYRRALRLNPHLFAVHFALARIQTRRGSYDEAERIYRSVLRTARTPEVIRKAFRLGVDLSDYLGRMESLEKDVRPLAATASIAADVYRQLLVDLYRRRIPPLMHQAQHGDGPTRTAAREALRRIGVRGMAPLLEELASSTHASSAQQELVRLLGYLGNPNAVLPLLRLAEREQEEQTVTVHGKRSHHYGGHYGAYRQVATEVSQRVEATLAVGRLADERAVPGLIRLLSSPEGALRDAAAWALTQVRDRRGARALFRALGDRRTTVQVMACAGLGIQGDRETRPALEEVMLDPSRSALVRAACAWGLGALGDPRAVTSLEQVLNAGDDELQRCAAWALGVLSAPGAVAVLVRSLWTKRPQVRRAVVWALVRISTNTPLPIDRTGDVVVSEGRIDAEQFVRRLTVGVDDLEGHELASRMPALIRSHQQAIGHGLRNALARHRDVVLRVLQDLDHDSDRPTLGPLTAGAHLLGRDARAEMERSVAAVASQVAPDVARLLAHRDQFVRRQAASVYAKIARSGAREQLEALVDRDRSSSVRSAALTALGVAHRRGVVDRQTIIARTSSALRSQSWREREAAVELLRTLAHASAVPHLRSALSDRNGFVREAATLALARSSGAAASTALLAALEDDVPHVRAAACRGLATRRVRRAAPAIRRLLSDASPVVRRAAEEALSVLR